MQLRPVEGRSAYAAPSDLSHVPAPVLNEEVLPRRLSGDGGLGGRASEGAGPGWLQQQQHTLLVVTWQPTLRTNYT